MRAVIIFYGHGSLRIKSGQTGVTVGSSLLKRTNKRRKDFYIAAQFDGGGAIRNVYYGKVLLFIQYEFTFASGKLPTLLFIAEWGQSLQKSSMGQVYSRLQGSRLFGNVTVEDVGIITHGIGMFHHQHPGTRRKAAFFLDPQRDMQHLLEMGNTCFDGVDRRLSGLAVARNEA